MIHTNISSYIFVFIYSDYLFKLNLFDKCSAEREIITFDTVATGCAVAKISNLLVSMGCSRTVAAFLGFGEVTGAGMLLVNIGLGFRLGNSTKSINVTLGMDTDGIGMRPLSA